MTEHPTIPLAVAPDSVKQIGLVGTGIIGSGWAAHFLAQGLDVVATDPHPQAEQTLRAHIDKAWPSLENLGLAEGASRERLRFTPSMEQALGEADFIQESVPESETIKDQVMAAISDVARPDVVIASSTSGIVPTRLQQQCRHPERMIVGHPFNPVYLLPLVEVVAGQHTRQAVIDWTLDFYRHVGKSPLHCRTEKLKHIGNRLQAAIFSEMLHLVAEGAATPAELDAALTDGPGLRWALMGSSLTYHLASGEGGIGEGLAGYHSPPLRPEMAAPTVDKALSLNIAEGALAQAAGHSSAEMAQMRDGFLVNVLKLRADIEARYGFKNGRFYDEK